MPEMGMKTNYVFLLISHNITPPLVFVLKEKQCDVSVHGGKALQGGPFSRSGSGPAGNSTDANSSFQRTYFTLSLCIP